MIKELILFIHLIICLYFMLYALIIKNTKYDYIYLMLIYIIFFLQVFLKGECLLSYLFKNTEDNNYVLGTDKNNDDFYYLFGKYRNCVLFIKNILMLLTIYLLYKRNDNYIYRCLIIILIILFIFYRYILRIN